MMKYLAFILLSILLLFPISYADEGGGEVIGVIADADGPYSGLVNATIQFYGSATNGSAPYTFEWDFDYNGTFTVDSTEQYPNHSYSTAGTYVVALRVTDSGGNISIDTTYAYIYEEANNPPIVDFVWRPRYPKVGELVRFYDLSVDLDGSIASWKWDFGNGDKDNIKNPTTRYNEAGTYVVTLTVTDDDGAKATLSVLLRVYEEEVAVEEKYTVVVYYVNKYRMPLENVNVHVYNESGLLYSLHTDENGSVKFNVTGKISIIAEKMGYEDMKTEVYVYRDMSIVIEMSKSRVDYIYILFLIAGMVAVAYSAYKLKKRI